MPTKKVIVATHGHCFDGLCSAVMFTRLLRALRPGEQHELHYHGAGYGPGQNGVDPKLLVGDENAILDFRFSRHPALTWYFDHHVTAFGEDEDRVVYDAYVNAHEGERRQMFHDGAYTSCTKLIADIGLARFGIDSSEMKDFVRWADMIDSAAFPNAQMAVDRKEPALQLMTVVEHHGNDEFISRMVPRLMDGAIEEVALSKEIQDAFVPLIASQQKFVDLVTQHAMTVGQTVLVDLLDRDLEAAAKFVTYALFPASAYSVIATRSQAKCKLSIGYNPWCTTPRTHDIAAICKRHGGGGHPVVGAISLAAAEIARARQLAVEIAEELGTG